MPGSVARPVALDLEPDHGHAARPRRGRPAARALGARGRLGHRRGRDLARLLRPRRQPRLGGARRVHVGRPPEPTSTSARSSSATCSATPRPTAATWARTCGGPSSSSTTGSRSAASRAGRPTGTRVSRRAVLLPVAGGDGRGPRPPAVRPVQRRVQARDRVRAADAPGRRRTTSPRGLQAPWPAPPAFAIAALGMLMETRTDWQIYGGNIASTLAGEFSFTIALALALFGLGALAFTLDTGRRRWLPAVLIAAAIMSHIVVGIFIALAAIAALADAPPVPHVPARDRRRRRRRCCSPSVWTVPLLANQAYTQSMRYTKLVPKGSFKLWSWLPLPGPVRNTVNGFVRALGSTLRPDHAQALIAAAVAAVVDLGCSRASRSSPRAGTAGARRSCCSCSRSCSACCSSSGPSTRSGTRGSCRSGCFTWGFLAAMGATEICRWLGDARRRGVPMDTRRRPARRARSRVGRARDLRRRPDDRPRSAQGSGVGARRASLRPRTRQAGSRPSGCRPRAHP